MDTTPVQAESTRAIVIGGQAYAWKTELSKSAIAARKTGERMQTAVNLFALVSTVGLFVIFLVFAMFFLESEQVLSGAFVTEPSTTGLALALSIFFGCFTFYRFFDTTRRKARLPELPEDAPAPEPAAVSGETEPIERFFHQSADEAVEEAYALASRFDHARIDPIHLVIGAMATQELPPLFARLGIKFDRMKDAVTRRLQTRQVGGPPVLSDESQDALLAAFASASRQGREAVHAIDVFSEAYARAPFIRELLFDLNVSEEQMANAVEWLRINAKLRERYHRYRKAAAFKPTGPMNRAMTSVATPNLDAVSEDLTTSAVKGRLPLMIGREQEMEAILRTIEGGNQSAVLVGPEGVGKMAVVAGLAERMVQERVPKVLQDKRLVRLSLTHLVSGVSAEVAQERLLLVLGDVAKAGNIILVVDDIDQMLTAGEELAALFVDFLARGSTFAIATTVPERYSAVVERSLLGRAFQKVLIKEPDINTAIRVLESRIGGIENKHAVIFSYEAVEKAVKLSDRYMHEAYLPEKAIRICREAALQVAKSRGEHAFVNGEDIAAIISQKTNIPVSAAADEEKEKLLNLEDKLHERVIGQDEAVESVAAALRRARAELKSEDRPIANFLFMGPTGVGKTELAKTVAEAYFGSEDNMRRFDMSEYQNKTSLARMIGAPGSNEGGHLTEAVRKNPFSIVLLDELEKAHPDILNLFLQVFDDGRLTDAAGRTIDFTNAIIIATSNAGAQYIQEAVREGRDIEGIKTHLLEEELPKHYRPEFINRFDGVIVFKPLTMDEVEQIAYLMMETVSARLEAKGIGFRATDEAVKELAQKGYDPEYGARPLRRVVQEQVDDAVASAILEGRVGRRDTIVFKEGGEIEIEKAEAL